MELLVLGGTVFLGRHFVEAALARGHQVTLFNRGRSNPNLFSGIEQIHGDRDGELSALAGRSWQAVVDTSGYVPRIVRDSAHTLRDAVRQYLFVSTVSVYADFSQSGIDEESKVAVLEDPANEIVTGASYGPMKARCEQIVLEAFPDHGLVIRPGLIVGPNDPTDRFTYWPKRVAEGGVVLAPENSDWETQIIDVRDLAEWMIQLLERGGSGTYNAVGPEKPIKFAEILEASRKISGSDATWTWVSREFLLENEVAPWSQLPLWLDGPEYAGMDKVSNRKALKSGLQFRPLEQTVQDTITWADTRPPDYQMRAGLDARKEQELLDKWMGLSQALK